MDQIYKELQILQFHIYVSMRFVCVTCQKLANELKRKLLLKDFRCTWKMKRIAPRRLVHWFWFGHGIVTFLCLE